MLGSDTLSNPMTTEVEIPNTSHCGCDNAHDGRALISIDDALSQIANSTSTVSETECVALENAMGRILSEPVTAQSNLPPFDNSAMDGFAINTGSLVGSGPWAIRVTDRIPAGRAGHAPLTKGQAARIFTGAPVPMGADAVVAQEDVSILPNGIVVNKRPKSGTNIRRRGEELSKGSPVMPLGTKIGARAIAACAAAGLGQVTVRRRIRVGVLVTGNELQTSGQSLEGAGIWDVNTPYLRAALNDPSVELVEMSYSADNPQQLKKRLSEMAADVDLLITTGAVSVGEEDHVKPALKAIGGELQFSGVAIKPGKPVCFGRIGATSWIGLPGNPLAVIVTWKVFGTAILQQLSGQRDQKTAPRTVQTGCDVKHRPGRTELRPAHLLFDEGLGIPVAHFEDTTHSARVTGLPNADGLLVIPAETTLLPKGSKVEFIPFCEDQG